MKHYVFVTEIDDKWMKRIRDNFKFIYNVDLDDKKYDDYDSIDKKWNAIIEDTLLGQVKKTKEVNVPKFMQLLYLVLDGEQCDIVRAYDIEAKKRLDKIQEFKNFISEMQTFLDNYEIYEPDVWLNAYLSIQYIKARREFSEDSIVGSSVDIYQPYCVTVKGKPYTIPFETYQERFCEGYIKKIGNKDQILILGAPIDENSKNYIDYSEQKEFQGYKKRVELTFEEKGRYDKRYIRWERQKVYSLEQSENFQTEDKVMFCKTINGALVRNLVDTMISTEHTYDIEDYLYLVDKLCICKSLNWQNLIGCLYIAVSCHKQKLMALNLWADIEVLFEVWFMHLEVINHRLELMVKGLIYIIRKQDESFNKVNEVEDRCKVALEKIGRNPIPFSERVNALISKEWKNQQEELRMIKEIADNHRQYTWIYAIMQRYVIDGLTPKKCNALRERERDWDDIVSSISSYYSVMVNLEGQNSDLIKAGKEIINIGEACNALVEKKQKSREEQIKKGMVVEEVFSKEELLNEIESRLREVGWKCNKRRILNRVLKIYINMKAKEKHGDFKVDESSLAQKAELLLGKLKTV